MNLKANKLTKEPVKKLWLPEANDYKPDNADIVRPAFLYPDGL